MKKFARERKRGKKSAKNNRGLVYRQHSTKDSAEEQNLQQVSQ
jgi:hypothetical protein